MRSTTILFFISFLVLLGAAGYAVFAQETADISYPVKELANCQNEQECRTYCDDSENMGACVAFAERHNLISKEEAQRAEAFLLAGSRGPGECKGQQECENYCADVSHIEECLAFAERTGLMPPEELEEAQKVAQALRSGAQLPGSCTNKNECEAYCNDSSHMKECIDFAEKAGFMSGQELQEAKQVLKAFEAGLQTPGNCKGKKQCDAFCSDQSNAEECFTFAVAAGFIPPEEAEQARKMMSLMAEGGMPGNCRSKEECENYCTDESNIEECANAFTKAGFMSEEEKEMFLKTGGKGPGECKGRDECESFCNDPANQETCFQFGKEHGLISEEDLANIEGGMKQAREGLESAPPEVASCLQDKVGEEVLSKIRAGTFTPNPEIGEAMRTCFEENMPQGPPPGMQGEGGMPGDQGQFQGGPGGCKSQEECQSYCSENPEQCGGSAPPQGGMPGQPRQEERMPQEREMIPEGLERFEGLIPQAPSSGGAPYQEQYQQQYQEQFQKQYQEQYQQQVQQQQQQEPQPQQYPSPPPTENTSPPPPGGFILDALLFFLGVISGR